MPPSGLYRRDDRCQSKVEDQTVQILFPPIELATLAAVLRRDGAEVAIRDDPALGSGWGGLRADLERRRPDMVLAHVTTATREQDFAAFALAKEVLGADRVLTVAVGEYIDAFGARALDEHPEIDVGFYGEIEETLLSWRGGAPEDTIDGLVWRDEDGRARRSDRRPLVADLDALPLSARDLLDNRLYRSPETGRPLTVVPGHRGCTSRCIFCPAGPMSGHRVRFRSPQRVMDEIAECVERHGIREFLFHGDTFTINKRWLIELCDLIIESGLRIRWGCNSRVDTIDDARAERMKRAGCWVVAFGVESGSPAMLEYMKKGQTTGQAERAVAVCRRHGLRVHTFFVIGLPPETRETLEETDRFVRRLDPDFFDFNIAYPLPGTELFDVVEREGLWEHPTDRAGVEVGYGEAAVRTHALSARELTEWRRRHLLRLYLRPRYIARTLWRAGSPRVAWFYARAAARKLWALCR